MKNLNLFYVYLLWGLLLCACTNPTEVPPSYIPSNESSFLLSEEDAKNALNELLATIDTDATRATTRRATGKAISFYGQKYRTASNEEEDNPIFYIFNLTDEQGYAVVSTDSRTTPVFAVTDSGTYDPANENTGFQLFMQLAENRYYQEIAQSEVIYPWVPVPGPGEDPQPTDWATTARLNPIIQTTWSQDYPFNRYCRTTENRLAKAGCAPIAVAQLTAMHNYPKNYNEYHLDWTKLIKSNLNCDIMYPTETHNLARFIAYLGELMKAEYGVASTSVNRYNVVPCFEKLGYTHPGEYLAYNCNKIVASLHNDNPVLIMGADFYQKTSHIWIIDGYIYQFRYAPTFSITQPAVKKETRYLLHCNWGWAGQDDGYYYEGVFDTSDPYTPSAETTRSKYNLYLEMITNINPYN